MMLTCKEVSHLVSEGLDRKLGLGERVALRLHLAICQGCTNFSKQMEFLRRAAQGLGPSATWPPILRSKGRWNSCLSTGWATAATGLSIRRTRTNSAIPIGRRTTGNDRMC